MGCNWGVLVNLDDGSFVVLGEVLARAGEGTIYAVVDRSEWVAKVFHAQGRGVGGKGEKLGAMIAHPPPGAVQSDGFAVLTWPVRLLVDAGGVVGYVMPRVDTSDAVEIHRLSNPVDRGNPLPSAPQWPRHASWLHLVNVAANLCLAVDVVHRVDAVIGDFQERNILVNDTTRVTLVDCDSMQVKGSDGRFFLCGVGRPEFTAPELAGVDLGVTPRGRASDLFALAVHIHLLLMAGNHPFLRGQWAGGGDQPDALSLARSGQWAGGPGSMLLSHPLAPSVGFLPPRVYGLFVRAFTDGARDPSLRPTAAEWRKELEAVQVTNCPRGHQIPVEADPCPWCSIDDERARRRAQRDQPVPDQKVFQAGRAAPAQFVEPGSVPVVARSGNTTKILIGAGAVVAVLIGVIAALLARGSSPAPDRDVSARDSGAVDTSVVMPPAEVSQYPMPASAPPIPAPPPAAPAPSPVATIVGTCDEGGSCGVKQRTAPYVSAPRLYPDDLHDGVQVTLSCQTVGDVRSSAGHGSSSTWYRLNNGAYVNMVYMDPAPAGLPSC